MTDDFELERNRARSRKLRDGVDGTFPPPQNPEETRPPTPAGVLGPRGMMSGEMYAAKDEVKAPPPKEDKSKRRKSLDDAIEEAGG